MPSLTGFASARGLAAAVCATHRMLAQGTGGAGGDKDVVLELDTTTGEVRVSDAEAATALPTAAQLLSGASSSEG